MFDTQTRLYNFKDLYDTDTIGVLSPVSTVTVTFLFLTIEQRTAEQFREQREGTADGY